jgi:uncharacterized protein YcbK (DUF882 family)
MLYKMSKLDDLRIFLIEKERRNPDLGPAKRKGSSDTRTSQQELEDIVRRNNQALAENREQSRQDSAREGMANTLESDLKNRNIIPKTSEDTEEIAMMKEGGGDGGGGLAGGGTVAVASDPGVFSSTYGGDSKRRLGMQSHKKKKKKKKKEKDKYQTSGVTKLDRFLRDEKINQLTNSKSVSVAKFAEWLVDDVRKALRPENRDNTGGVGVNEPPTNETHRGKVRNPWGSKGKFKALRGQQGYTMDFKKMENIANTLDSGGTVIDLIKAIDMDAPVEVD